MILLIDTKILQKLSVEYVAEEFVLDFLYIDIAARNRPLFFYCLQLVASYNKKKTLLFVGLLTRSTYSTTVFLFVKDIVGRDRLFFYSLVSCLAATKKNCYLQIIDKIYISNCRISSCYLSLLFGNKLSPLS